jgi:hypothetical protein
MVVVFLLLLVVIVEILIAIVVEVGLFPGFLSGQLVIFQTFDTNFVVDAAFILID